MEINLLSQTMPTSSANSVTQGNNASNVSAEQIKPDLENDTPANKIPQDEYISSEKAGNRPSGTGVKSADGDDKSEKCTTNTDSVDKEIEKLKEEKKQIEQQIRSANGDEEKKKELERKLEQIENELSQKDTDSYRRQNAVINDEG
jgi:predicted RNase H-like nuclease (RuvC/YqgF family)